MERTKNKELADLVIEIIKTEPNYYSALNEKKGEGNFSQIRIEGYGQKLHSLSIEALELIKNGAEYNFSEEKLNQIRAYARSDFL